MSDFDYLNDEETPDPEEKPNPVKSLRNALKAREKELKEMESQLEELRSFKANYEREQKVASLAGTFEEVGLTSKHAELFDKLNPEAEANAEAIKAFAEEYQLPLKEPEGDDAPAPRSEPFAPASGGQPVESGYVSRAQLDEMYKQNPKKAIETLRSGRVQWNNPDE